MHPYQKAKLIKGVYVLAAVIAVVGAFFGGMAYQKTKTHSPTTANAGGFGRFGGRLPNGASATFGSIDSISGQTITITAQDGSSKKIDFSSSTTISQDRQPAQSSDLQTGERIAAIGQTNSDGSIQATRIIINPGFGGSGNSGGQAPPTSTNSS